MSKLYSSAQIVKVLRKKGFVLISQRGSHAKFRKASKTVIVPMAKKEIPMGTFHSIVRQSGLKKNDF
ncbi:MAG: type II toxin-antitoxin system HicA family toxin [bacterium]|nr:type II toxin-antitoxin system HicA family toxin [bacterium]